jgi:hypothetical protein
MNLSHLRSEVPKAEYYSVGAANRSALTHPELKLFPYWEYYYYIPREFADELDEPIWAEAAGGPWSYRYDCPVSSQHVTHKWFDDKVSAILHGRTRKIPPFVPDGDIVVPLVNGELAKSLRSSKLKGLFVRSVNLDRLNTGRPHSDELCFLAGPLPLPTVPRRISPAIVNRCPFCGYEPYFCQSCGFCSPRCPECRKLAIQWDNDESDSENALRFDIALAFPEELNQAAGAIDMSRCGNVDFSGNCDFSRLALEFLIEAKAYPLQIRPLKALFDDRFLGYTRDDAVPIS